MRKLILIIALAAFPFTLFAQWFQVTSPTSSTLYAVYFTSPSTGYVSGSLSGTIVKTTNGGAAWIFLSTGTSSTFYDMFFTDQQTGFIAGSSKNILKTTNAGANWDIKSTGTGTFSAMSFISTFGYAVGRSPAVMERSINSGNNWTTVVPPSSNALRGCWFSTPSIGWVCGSSGTIMKTTNGCATWIPQIQSTSITFEKIQMFGTSAGYVCGSGGTLLKTVNSGTNWIQVPTGVTTTLYDIYLYNSLSGWVVGANGTIVKTSDGGANWYTQQSPVTNTLYAIQMLNSLTGFIVGSSGVLLKTTNGGGDPLSVKNNELPVKYELKQNYPNPFNPATNIEYSILRTSKVNLSVYDMAGRLVSVLVNGLQNSGSYNINFDGTNLSSGVYFCKLETNEYSGLIKMVLLK